MPENKENKEKLMFKLILKKKTILFSKRFENKINNINIVNKHNIINSINIKIQSLECSKFRIFIKDAKELSKLYLSHRLAITYILVSSVFIFCKIHSFYC